MPGIRCAVAVCSSSKQKNKDCSFHRFPSDKLMRKQWIIACKRADEFNPNTSHICSEHFDVDDFQNDLKARLMNMPLKRLLKPHVVPHKNLPGSSLAEGTTKPSSEAGRKRRKRMEERNIMELRESHHEYALQPQLGSTNSSDPLNSSPDHVALALPPQIGEVDYKTRCEDLMKRHTELLKKNATVRLGKEDLRLSLRSKIEKITSSARDL